jgi:hypothetical protein
MRRREVLSLVAVVGIGLMPGGASVWSQDTRNVASFNIEVTLDSTNHEVRFKCIDGCAWEALSFSCGNDVECTSSIDEYGTPTE